MPFPVRPPTDLGDAVPEINDPVLHDPGRRIDRKLLIAVGAKRPLRNLDQLLHR